MRRLRVVSPGPRTTVEDLGRRHVARYGIPAGGAFDALALVAANRLVGNRDDAAGLEMTLGGATLVNDGDEALQVALVGADCAATLVQGAGGMRMPLAAAVPLAPGATLRLGFARDGARTWLAVAGGIDVAPVLGSRSTVLLAGLGGFAGRALERDDELPVGAARGPARGDRWTDDRPPAAAGATVVLRVLPGPQAQRYGEAGMQALVAVEWTVQNDSDRTGVRLAAADGAVPAVLRDVAGIAPEGTTLGAIQMPPDGRPIVLGPDRPVTGGYAKPALVIAADLGRLARLRPGDRVRLALVALDQARRLAAARRATLPPEGP